MEVKESLKFTTNLYAFLNNLGMHVQPVEFVQTTFAVKQIKPDTPEEFKNVIIPIMAKNMNQAVLIRHAIDFILTTSGNWDAIKDTISFDQIDQGILKEAAPTIAKMADWIENPDLFYKMLEQLYRKLYEQYDDRAIRSGYTMLSDALELNKPEKEIVALTKVLELNGWCSEDIAKIRSIIEGMVIFIRRNISEFLISASKVISMTGFMHPSMPKSGQRDLWDIPLFFLSRKELEQVNVLVRRVALRFRDKLRQRQYGLNTNEVSIRKTLRLNTGMDNIIHLDYKRIKKLESPLIVLCDVSSSMRNYARFFLQFLSVVKDVFRKVKVIIFVSSIHEITSLIKTKPDDEVISTIFAEYPEARTYTDYGSVFKQFVEQYFGTVTAKTRLLVVGDGRTNHLYPGDEELEKIKKKAKEIIWFNPEENYNWYLGDSEMSLYMQYTDRIFTVRTLRELISALESIA
ncbi:MAG: VWA domain-containing protein [Deltaproteobacteria bacterium]|nr:VWA domain-containing protein [Deltaproteobacteria bacterium]